MITLGIETSGKEGSIALFDGDEVVGETSLSREGRRHARTLLAEISRLLGRKALQPTDVETLAVSLGPGSFTGLRVGVTCVKIWAYATGARLVGVETFAAIAHQTTTDATSVHVISDAQRGELFYGRFSQRAANDWCREGEIAIIGIDEWVRTLNRDDLVTGPGVLTLSDRLEGQCRLANQSERFPTASSVARLGFRSAGRGEFTDAYALEPLYMRKSAAEEKADAADRSAAAQSPSGR